MLEKLGTETTAYITYFNFNNEEYYFSYSEFEGLELYKSDGGSCDWDILDEVTNNNISELECIYTENGDEFIKIMQQLIDKGAFK